MPKLHGEQHPARKLDDETVRLIRAAYIPGQIKMSDLGQQYGVTKQTISRIINGVSWKHVQDK